MSTLRRLRTNKLLTVEELSERTGVSVQTIYNLERGDISNPRIATVKPLSEFFEVDAALLVPALNQDRDAA